MEGESLLKKRKRKDGEEGQGSPPKKKRKSNDEEDFGPDDDGKQSKEDDLVIPSLQIPSEKVGDREEENKALQEVDDDDDEKEPERSGPLQNSPNESTTLTYKVLELLKVEKRWMTIPKIFDGLKRRHSGFGHDMKSVQKCLRGCVIRHGAKKRPSSVIARSNSRPLQEYSFKGELPNKNGRAKTTGVNRTSIFLKVLEDEGRWMTGKEVEDLLSSRGGYSSGISGEAARCFSGIFRSTNAHGGLQRRKRIDFMNAKKFEYLYVKKEKGKTENSMKSSLPPSPVFSNQDHERKRKKKHKEEEEEEEEEEESDDDDDDDDDDFVVPSEHITYSEEEEDDEYDDDEKKEEEEEVPTQNNHDSSSFVYKLLKLLKDSKRWMTTPQIAKNLRKLYPGLKLDLLDAVRRRIDKCVQIHGAKKRPTQQFGTGRNEYSFNEKLPSKRGRATPGINRSATFVKVLEEEGRWLSGKEVEGIVSSRYNLATCRSGEVGKVLSGVFRRTKGDKAFMKRRKRDGIFEYLFIKNKRNPYSNSDEKKTWNTNRSPVVLQMRGQKKKGRRRRKKKRKKKKRKEVEEEEEEEEEEETFYKPRKTKKRVVQPPPVEEGVRYYHKKHPAPVFEDDEETSDNSSVTPFGRKQVRNPGKEGDWHHQQEQYEDILRMQDFVVPSEPIFQLEEREEEVPQEDSHVQETNPPPVIEDDEEYSDNGPNALFYAALFGKYKTQIRFRKEKGRKGS